jgi:hypothetical protein
MLMRGRREFLLAATGTSLVAGRAGYFALGESRGKRCFLTPEGRPFFSVAMNHIDPATLRYGSMWRERYGNDTERWLRSRVRRDLRDWGFNSVGWVQDMASNGVTNHKQSRNFTFEEYQALGLPYCHMLPVAEFHHWDAQNKQPDFFAPEFAEWCDYVAREHCARMREDRKLIGYFLVDCPAWVHTHPHSRWRGAIFDWKRLENAEGRAELTRVATQYYRVVHEAIRRYDPNHLILGDRYEANGRMAEEVLLAAKPYVDVMSFQDFGRPRETAARLEMWARRTGKPVLLADAGRGEGPANGKRHVGTEYREIMEAVVGMEACVGFHLCGAYLKNRVRKKGLRDENDVVDMEAVHNVRRVNRELGWRAR